MSRKLMLIAAAVAIVPVSASWACGACDEDKIAATYDHAVVDRAMATHGQVVFVAIEGPVSAEQIVRRVAYAATKVRGIMTGTLRTSQSPTAFSFAIRATMNPDVAVSDFQKAVGGRDLRLILVRVMREGVFVGSN